MFSKKQAYDNDMRRCSHCKNVTLNTPNGGTWPPIYLSDLWHVGQAAAEGCELCSVLWERLQMGYDNQLPNLLWPAILSATRSGRPSKFRRKFHLNTSKELRKAYSFLDQMIWLEPRSTLQADPSLDRLFGLDPRSALEDSEGGQQWLDLEICPFNVKLHMGVPNDSAAATRFSGRLISHHGASDECTSLLLKWLDNCIKHHEKCRQSKIFDGVQNSRQERIGMDHTSNIPLLPTRVIDVGPIDGSQIPKLYIPPPNSRARYIALSYTWGGAQPLTLTTQALEERKSGISLDSMPLTHRDAVIVTRKVGVRYLWIDALCILQDSREDWASESAKMTTVYADSLFTISSGASSCHDSFLDRKTLASCKTAKVRFANLGTDVWISNYQFVNSRVARLPTDYRAWCMQEQVLSPRLVVFGDRMQWLCGSESYDESIGNWSGGSYLTPSLSLPQRGDALQSSQPAFWRKLVEHYTTLNLTYEQDKLPAISGLAALFQQETGREYVAGMWRETLEFDLMWTEPYYYAQPGGRGKPCKRPSTYCAPSWSWASVVGRLDYPTLSHKFSDSNVVIQPGFRVIDVAINVSSANPFGQIANASLTIQGRLAPISTCKVAPDYVIRVGHVSSPAEDTRSKYTAVFDVIGERDWPSENLWCLFYCGNVRFALILAKDQTDSTMYCRVGMVRSEDAQAVLWEEFAWHDSVFTIV